ncbi:MULTISPECIES: hypothetical protein [Streptomyces]|uniref:Ig-like domain-containing protein n=1 Tax=Streptomyces morookaense TaxID=1970 RepID=A0A7Y7B162_STRMO|nr:MULTISPECIES: hypothetical protein [Streptomyces]MCC2277720.1 hypothetical protein [Streptomyces sp. ET3-23]NVK77092.1 hypothetical protein [Streptomyces morookaense]GHF23940.1 hypothetical protein GCM10010359_27670 [Streptomyces morookaense]
MTIPLRRTRYRRRILAAGTAAMTLTALGSASAAVPRNSAMISLTCDGHTAPRSPVAISPPLGIRSRHTTVRGTLLLDHCFSPDGSADRLRSAAVDLGLSGTASCSGAHDVTGSGYVTWYATPDRTGRPVGRSTLGVRRPHADTWSAATPLPAIAVRTGTLAGHTVTVGAVGTPAALHCSTRGLRSLSGAFWVTVHPGS